MSINEETVTIGKYKNLTINELLRDRKYCKWLLTQEWFEKQYPYIYGRIKGYKPLDKFLPTNLPDLDEKNFVATYPYFNLNKKVELNERDQKCYSFYLKTMRDLKYKLLENKSDNPYDIKAPVGWLKKFTKETGMDGDVLKTFIQENDLSNITKVVEDIKRMGGIEYKGGKSYIITKDKSKAQEKLWEERLKRELKERVCTQYKLDNCIFDFIDIQANTIYECKLNLKDIDRDQYKKYSSRLSNYKVIYLISDYIYLDLNGRIIKTTNVERLRGELDKYSTVEVVDYIRKKKFNVVSVKEEEFFVNYK